jgi:hypothetical protein
VRAQIDKDFDNESHRGPRYLDRLGVVVRLQAVETSMEDRRVDLPSPPSLAEGHSVAIRVKRRDTHTERIVLGCRFHELNAVRQQRLEVLPQVIRFDERLSAIQRDLSEVRIALSLCYRRQDHIHILAIETHRQPPADLEVPSGSDWNWVVPPLHESKFPGVEVQRLVLLDHQSKGRSCFLIGGPHALARPPRAASLRTAIRVSDSPWWAETVLVLPARRSRSSSVPATPRPRHALADRASPAVGALLALMTGIGEPGAAPGLGPGCRRDRVGPGDHPLRAGAPAASRVCPASNEESLIEFVRELRRHFRG